MIAYWVLLVKPEGKRQVRRGRYRWEGNIKMDLRKIGCGLIWLKIGIREGLL
jgi:hypothetical protein